MNKRRRISVRMSGRVFGASSRVAPQEVTLLSQQCLYCRDRSFCIFQEAFMMLKTKRWRARAEQFYLL